MLLRSLVGKPAPQVTLPSYNGTTFAFVPGERGLPSVLFFYPCSGTYGCTKEACQFRDAIGSDKAFHPDKVIVIGISPDPVQTQKEFVEKEKLPYPILSDTSKDAFEKYGIGKGLLGLSRVARVTFIIDKKGVVRDALDATLNYAAHYTFAKRWLNKLEKEEDRQEDPPPSDTAE